MKKTSKFQLPLTRWLLLWLALLVFAAILTQYLTYSPKIEVTAHKLEEKGDRVLLSIMGKRFGEQSKDAKIMLNGKELEPSYILTWQDSQIQISMRKPFNYALVQIQQSKSLSELIPIWHPDFLPQQIQSNQGTDKYPVLEKFRYISDTIMEVQGQNFGLRYTSQLLLLSRRTENYKQPYFSPSMLENYRPLQPEEILLWNDNTIQFIVPQEIIEGPIYLLRRLQQTNPQKDPQEDSQKNLQSSSTSLQVSNNLYIPSKRQARPTSTESTKLRLSLQFPKSIVSNMFPLPPESPAAELQTNIGSQQAAASNKKPNYLEIQWPRNTQNQRWAYIEIPKSESLNLPAESLELQAIPDKVARNLELPANSWLASPKNGASGKIPSYLEFFYSPIDYSRQRQVASPNYSERELSLYAALLRRNLAFCSHYEAPTRGEQIPENLSPYAKALRIYGQILQDFDIQTSNFQAASQAVDSEISRQLQNWPELPQASQADPAKAQVLPEQILLVFLHSLTRLDIPARIIAGARRTATAGSKTLQPYFWLEIYLPNFGWFPADLVAELAARHSQSNAQANQVSYWGALEPSNSQPQGNTPEQKIAFFALRDRWQDYDFAIRKYGIYWNLEDL